jgi:P-type Mg2+ transporter
VAALRTDQPVRIAGGRGGTSGVSIGATNSAATLDKSYWSLPPPQLLAALDSTPDGLTAEEAGRRQSRYGFNILPDQRRVTGLRLWLAQFRSPLMLILLFAAAVALLAQDVVNAATVLAIVFGSAMLGFAQEYRANAAMEQLRARITLEVDVMRAGAPARIAASALVPGDIVLLMAGTLIPADGVALTAKDLFVNQSVLTGETFPVEKRPGNVAADAGLPERTNCLFAGTSVRSGTGTMLVAHTGARTMYGGIAAHLARRAPEPGFERGLRQFSALLMRIMFVLVIAVFAINVALDRPLIESLLFAIALAVGLSPELLPAILTITLAHGARIMARGGVIVRRLNAIENLGGMDVFCTDKTGTLTEGIVRLEGMLDVEGESSARVAAKAFLNAHFQTGLANPLDAAIDARAKEDGFDFVPWHKLDEIPYDFLRKRLSIALVDAHERRLLVTKGALANVLEVCAYVDENGEPKALTDAHRGAIQARLRGYTEQGYRVLGVAYRALSTQAAYTRADERDLVFAGFLLFFDPPDRDARRALADLGRLGVKVKIITGDNPLVALHVAKEVGLKVTRTLTGAELRGLRDEALWHLAARTQLFAEVDPNQKEQIILALKRTGHVVGYLGDGINDAPALHAADVGISVRGAVDVAKQAADFVLLERGLDVLRRGIEEGRTTFANTLKYISVTTSANFGNMISMAAASLFLPFLPLLAKQILLNNFLSDIPSMAIAGDNVDREWDRTPHRWDVRAVRNFMITFGLVSSVFDFLTFGVLLLLVGAAPDLFRTGWFVESLLTELFIVLIIRTHRPFYRSRPGRLLLGSTLVVAALTLLLPYLPFANLFDFQPLPAALLIAIAAITVLYLGASEGAKRWFYRKPARSKKHQT